MGKRLTLLSMAALRQPPWLVAVVMAGSFGVLMAIFFLCTQTGAPDVLRDLLDWLFLLWFGFAALYLAVRIFRHYCYGDISLREALITVAVIQALGLAWLTWGPLVFQFAKSYAAEIAGFDYWIYPAAFVAAWAFVSVLIALRYRKPARVDATGMRLVCAAGICAFLLAIAAGVQAVVPEFKPVYASFGADLPGPTLLMFDFYPYVYALPLLGAVLAGFGLLVSGARARRAAFDGQIALLAASNLIMVFGLTAMSLPILKMCGNIWEQVQQAQETGFTRLHAAASLGRTESVLRQVARGAPIDLRDKHGNTPLHHAVYGNRAETARALLARGADVGVPGKRGNTPLHSAVERATWRDTASLELVQLLLERGAPVSAEGDFGVTPLHVAAASYRRTDLAALLLARGADINAVAERGTPLDLAYESRNQAMIELLRQHGAVRSIEQQREAKKHSFQVSAARAGSCGA